MFIRFICRSAASLAFLIMVALTMFVANVAIFTVFEISPTVRFALAGAAIQMLVAMPALLVLCLTGGDSPRTRLRVLLKAVVPLSVLCLLWVFWARPWYQAHAQGMSTQWGILIGVGECLGFAWLMNLSSFLVSGSLPSLRGRASGRRPNAIKFFALNMAILLGIYGLVTFVEMPNTISRVTPADLQKTFGDDAGVYFFIALFLTFYLYEGLLAARVAISGSKAARTELVAMFLMLMPGVLPALMAVLQTSVIGFVLMLGVLAFHALTLRLAYVPAARRWFSGEDSSEDDTPVPGRGPLAGAA